MLQADVEALNEIQGVGDVIARAFVDYFAIDGNQKGKGLGSKMLKHFMETAGETGYFGS